MSRTSKVILAILAAIALGVVAAIVAPVKAADAADTIKILGTKPHPAYAYKFTAVTPDRAQAAINAAHARFPRTPCTGRTRWTFNVSAARMTIDGEVRGGLAYAFPSCRVDIAPMPDAEYLCRVAVHEKSHLAGHGHIDNPTDITHGGYLDRALSPECDNAFPTTILSAAR